MTLYYIMNSKKDFTAHGDYEKNVIKILGRIKQYL